ncbi:exported hypothetical protein [Rubrivivax sp. A210]|uniref:OmpA family protein n=1 Tax=Rubrivivax sp. A210 TaxID=2772301 RepID=UPI001919168F|nr:OmpA family protein [Rubrivivax sp. A210]CAD5373267.1 exported hypothetical protein [Rubrivivax sp. A210]
MQTRRTLMLMLALAPLAAPAQTAAPDTPTMIEALKPAATRGLRNLVVRQKAEAEPASASAASAPAAAPMQAAANAAPPPAALTAPAGPPPSLSLAIQFENNSAQVRPESGRVLGNLVAAMQSPELKGVRFAIEGHTDARGGAQANQALSQQRADEVRLYLIALGVHPARLRAVGKGASEPANPFDPAASENRRVRVVTLE